ncbi:MAG: helix-turn-helix transcriptional regulator [Polyangiales bacterium]
MAKADYRDVIDACYRPAASGDAWCKAFIDAISPLMPPNPGVGIAVFDMRGGRIQMQSSHLDRAPDAIAKLASAYAPTLAPSREGRLLYTKSPLNFVSTVFAGLGADGSETVRSALAQADASNMVGVLGYPVADTVVAFTLPVPTTGVLPPRTRAALLRIRQHMELGLAHLLQPARQPVAIVRPDGTFAQFVGDAVSADAAGRIGQHVRMVDRIRRSTHVPDSFDALAMWRAVVDGRWSMVEREDSDGKRYHLVFENVSEAHRHRALTALEAQTLRLFASGLSGKEVAAALRQAPSTVSERLGCVADKLGLRTRDDVLRLNARAVGATRGASSFASLTEAERAVLSEVVLGRRDAEIARARSTSPSTVRKQVASLRHKLDAPTRSVLASRGAPGAS